MKTRSKLRTKLSKASTKRSGCLLLSKQTKHKQKQNTQVSTPKVPSQRRSTPLEPNFHKKLRSGRRPPGSGWSKSTDQGTGTDLSGTASRQKEPLRTIPWPHQQSGSILDELFCQVAISKGSWHPTQTALGKSVSISLVGFAIFCLLVATPYLDCLVVAAACKGVGIKPAECCYSVFVSL